MGYINRQDAGRRLAKDLERFADKDTVVLALPRGGIVLGAEVARALHAPLGVVLVRKIGFPLYEEYAVGAIVEGQAPLYDESVAETIDPQWLRENEVAARHLLQYRRGLYYGDDFQPPAIKGRTVLLVDDGIATGLTMRAAVRAVRNEGAKHVIVAVPVASPDSVETLSSEADEVVVLDDPNEFIGAVGAHYREFEQVDDEEVRRLLREVNQNVHAAATTNA